MHLGASRPKLVQQTVGLGKTDDGFEARPVKVPAYLQQTVV
jgi:hypothetical protein